MRSKLLSILLVCGFVVQLFCPGFNSNPDDFVKHVLDSFKGIENEDKSSVCYRTADGGNITLETEGLTLDIVNAKFKDGKITWNKALEIGSAGTSKFKFYSSFDGDKEPTSFPSFIGRNAANSVYYMAYISPNRKIKVFKLDGKTLCSIANKAPNFVCKDGAESYEFTLVKGDESKAYYLVAGSQQYGFKGSSDVKISVRLYPSEEYNDFYFNPGSPGELCLKLDGTYEILNLKLGADQSNFELKETDGIKSLIYSSDARGMPPSLIAKTEKGYCLLYVRVNIGNYQFNERYKFEVLSLSMADIGVLRRVSQTLFASGTLEKGHKVTRTRKWNGEVYLVVTAPGLK